MKDLIEVLPIFAKHDEPYVKGPHPRAKPLDDLVGLDDRSFVRDAKIAVWASFRFGSYRWG